MKLLCFLLSASIAGAETIGVEALQTTPASAHYSGMVNFKPGDGETVTLNPPRFSWCYNLDPETIAADQTVKLFRFEISPNSNMSSPVLSLVTPSNLYNRLAPFTPGNTYYWQVEYRSGVTVDASNDYFAWTNHGMTANTAMTVSALSMPGGLAADTTYFVRDVFVNNFKLAATAGGAAINITSNGTEVRLHRMGSIRSFTVSAGATSWDRSQLADTQITGGAVEADDNIYTKSSHGINDGGMVQLISLTNGAGLTMRTRYFFHALDANTGTFHLTQVAAIAGTGAIDVTTDATSVVLGYNDYLADKTHPYMLFNTSNRAAVADVVDGLNEWTTWVNAANTTIAQSWWTGGTKPDPLVVPEYDWASRIHNVAFIYQMTQNASYAGANAAIQLALLSDYFKSSNKVISDTVSGGSYELSALVFGYDWWYDVLDATQKANVLNAFYIRARYLVKCGCWEAPNGNHGISSFYADITGAYTAQSSVPYPTMAKNQTSHPWFNWSGGMPVAFTAMNEDPASRELLDLVVDYMIGYTWPYGQFGGMNQGRVYNISNTTDSLSSYMPLLANTIFTGMDFEKNPWFSSAGQFLDRTIPLKYSDPDARDPWGDGVVAAGLAWPVNGIGRYFTWLSQDGIIREHYENQLDVSYFGVPRPNNIIDAPLHYYNTTLPTPVTDYAKSQVWLEDGWAAGSSIVPNHVDSFTNGVGFVFQARPSGGKGSHDLESDGNVDIWAYGAFLNDGGNGLSGSYGHVSWAVNTVTVNGLGQLQPPHTALEPMYSKIMAYKATADYIYVAGDITEAYPDETFIGGAVPAAYEDLHDGDPSPQGHANLTKVHRHVLFMRGKYFVIFDDLASSSPQTWQWVWHISPDTVAGSPTTTFNYTVPGTGGNVAVYVQHIATGLGIDLTHHKTTDIAKNPITGEDYYADTWEVLPNYPRKANVMWIKSTGSSTTFNFLAVIFPVAPGGAAPTITRLGDDKTVQVVHTGIDDTISFDPANTTAGFIVNLAGSQGEEGGTINASNLNITGTLTIGAP